MSSPDSAGDDRTDERGSSLVVAVFVLALITTLGVALLFLSRNEVSLSQADTRTKRAYYFSEAGLEDGRSTASNTNRVSANPLSYNEELLAASGGLLGNGAFDFDPTLVTPVYDSAGNVTSFTGYGDDQPIRGMTAFSDGWYISFLSNDPIDNALNPLVDTNNRLMLSGIAAGRDRSFEVVEAVVEFNSLFPNLPAAITVLGPNAQFQGGNSNAKKYLGDDNGVHCPGGVAGGSVPVIGVISATSKTSAEAGVSKPSNYTTDYGNDVGNDTVSDISATDPLWTNCDLIVEFAESVKNAADLIGDSSTPLTDLGAPGNPKVVFIEGDYDISGMFTGAGLLFVTGTFTFDGKADWTGAIFVVGEGLYVRSGGGNGDMLGGVVVANVSGPDTTLFTSDDCSGDDGIKPSADDGVAQSSFDTSGGGGLTTAYCSSVLANLQAANPLEIVSFRQH